MSDLTDHSSTGHFSRPARVGFVFANDTCPLSPGHKMRQSSSGRARPGRRKEIGSVR